MAELIEIGRQTYKDCAFSGGLVRGHEVDTVYIKLDRPPEESMMILLRRDEALAIMQLLAGALWSEEMEKMKL